MLTPAPGGTRADAIALAARFLDSPEPIEFLRHLGDDDAYLRGPSPGGSLIVIPGIWTGMPPELLAAMRARRACSVAGRCPSCGACVELATGTYAHESDCPVSDDRLRPLLTRWVRKVGLVRGRRIVETP